MNTDMVSRQKIRRFLGICWAFLLVSAGSGIAAWAGCLPGVPKGATHPSNSSTPTMEPGRPYSEPPDAPVTEALATSSPDGLLSDETQAGRCMDWTSYETTGRITNAEITECSGLAVSRRNPGILWLHNDSGDSPRLFAVTETGEFRGIWILETARATDWEGLSWGPCGPDDPDHCLYVGDIGDNARIRSRIQVYRFREPRVPMNGKPAREIVTKVERFDCQYPNGPRNAETLLVDPQTAIPYIISKEKRGQAEVFRFPASAKDGDTVILEPVGSLPLQRITGGDISPDSARVILRNYWQAFEYVRLPDASLESAFAQRPCIIICAPERQGESLAIGPSGRTLYTVSEGKKPAIHKICGMN